MAELFKVNAPVRKPLFEGVQGENEARSIQFDITPWVEELGDGAVTATAKRSQDSQPYPVTVTKDGNVVTWKPTSTDTAFAGVGSFQLEYTVDSVLAKTCIWSTMVAPSLDPAGDPPDPYENWLAEMRQIAADALTSEQNAEDSAEDAEAWAVGQRGGVDVPSTDPTYENNAKYWAGQAEELKDDTQAIVDEARADVFEAMDGLHEETTAGSALQLISDKYTENKEPYLFRKSIAGDRELDTLVGGSVVWNQMSVAGATHTITGVTLTKNADGSVTVNGTSTGGPLASHESIPVIAGHKYLIWANDAWFKAGGSLFTSIGGNSGSAVPMIRNSTVTGSNAVSCARSDNGVTYNNVKLIVMTFDLTQMFGTAVADRLYQMEQAQAGSGVALFRSWFPKDYYEYNTGELMSVKTSAHEMVGFNQWDEEWEVGGLNAGSGATTAETDRMRSKNFIPVMPNTVYALRASAGGGLICCYDSNKTFISSIPGLAMAHASTFTTPSGCTYIIFGTYANYGNTYKSDICISFSSDRNGEYQPYTKHTYALDDIELRGVPKLDGTDIYFDGDTYEADGTVTRKYGIVDLGTLNWNKQTELGVYFGVPSSGFGGKPTPSVGSMPNIVSAKYTVATPSDTYQNQVDKTISVYTNGSLIVRDSTYSNLTAADFKSAMSGVYLVYELATPTTETADPFTSPQIVDAYGTERYVDERTVAVPVGHVTKYPDNLREKLDGLPWDFSSLIAPTEKTYTATRNYTTGALLIVNNTLYKVTANIANGGAITPNTNVAATTLAEVISAL